MKKRVDKRNEVFKIFLGIALLLLVALVVFIAIDFDNNFEEKIGLSPEEENTEMIAKEEGNIFKEGEDIILNPGETVTLSGTSLVEVFDDFNNPENSYFEYQLITDEGIEYKLNFVQGQEPNIISGENIAVSGLLSNAASGESILEVQNLEILNEGGVAGAQEENPSLGVQRVAILMVNVEDSSNYLTSTFSEITNSIYDNNSYTTRNYYKELSYNVTHFMGNVSDIYGYFILPTINDSLNYSKVIEYADDQVNFSKYNRILISDFLIFGSSNRGFSSLGKIAIHTDEGVINASISYVHNRNGTSFDTYVATHELGHGLGAHHSGTYECGDKTIDFEEFCQVISNSGMFHNLGSMHLGPSTKES